MRQLSVCLVLSVLIACSEKATGDDTASPEDTSAPSVGTDADGDGVTVEDGDCDDSDPERFPGRDEDCNGLDDDCDERVDEGFADTDEDGLVDCLDEEECDGLDNDGDGNIDEGFDADSDGIADCDEVEECNGLDDDGDGLVDEDFDLDLDGYTTCEEEPDCDDTDAEIFPGGTEIDGDLQDNDCNGLVDETTWRPGDLVISEVMISPLAVEDTRGEWIELTNTSSRTVVLNGLRVFSSTGNHLVQKTEWIQLDAGAQIVLGLSMNPSNNGGVPVDYAYSGINLNPDGDTLSIVMAGLILDDIVWDSEMPLVDGATLSLDPDRVDWIENDFLESWCSSGIAWVEGSDLGSPGQDNELCGQIDHDGDGLTADEGDCDDEDPDVYPGAPEVDVGIDNDCDGVAVSQPVAWADYDLSASSMSSCDLLQLDGSSSYDPDGDPLTFLWTVESAPETSLADTSWIISSTDERPTFTPDSPGDYRFSLTVDDGTLSSLPSYLTVTLNEPELSMVDAGSDQTQEETVSCGATSCDMCPSVAFPLATDAGTLPDAVDFSWSLSTEWGSVGIDDVTSSTPYVVVWGLEPEPGETVESVIEVTLGVSDCLDRVVEDTLLLTYRCTGG